MSNLGGWLELLFEQRLTRCWSYCLPNFVFRSRPKSTLASDTSKRLVKSVSNFIIQTIEPFAVLRWHRPKTSTRTVVQTHYTTRCHEQRESRRSRLEWCGDHREQPGFCTVPALAANHLRRHSATPRRERRLYLTSRSKHVIVVTNP